MDGAAPATVMLRGLSCLGLAAAAVSATAHTAGASHLGLVGAAVSIVMAAICLVCTAHLIRHPTASRAWLAMAAMAAAMIAVHMMVMGTGAISGHVHGAGLTVMPIEASTLMQVMIVASGAELLIAVAGLWVATSGRSLASEPHAKNTLQLNEGTRQ